MDITTRDQLTDFLTALGARCPFAANIYIFGGSAIIWMGANRQTGDVDFTIHSANDHVLRQIIQTVAAEKNFDLEESVPAEFMPLPNNNETRHQTIGQYGQITAYIFDLYSIALMKIDRAFERDIEDVHFLLRRGYINLAELEMHLNDIALRYDEPIKLRRNFEELKRGL